MDSLGATSAWQGCRCEADKTQPPPNRPSCAGPSLVPLRVAPLVSGSGPYALSVSLSPSWDLSGADDGIRTRDPHLGKVMLYQLSHVRVGLDFSSSPTMSSPGQPAIDVRSVGRTHTIRAEDTDRQPTRRGSRRATTAPA